MQGSERMVHDKVGDWELLGSLALFSKLNTPIQPYLHREYCKCNFLFSEVITCSSFSRIAGACHGCHLAVPLYGCDPCSLERFVVRSLVISVLGFEAQVCYLALRTGFEDRNRHWRKLLITRPLATACSNWALRASFQGILLK